MTPHKCHYCNKSPTVARESERKGLCYDHLIASACNGFEPYRLVVGVGEQVVYSVEMGMELWREREAKRLA